MTKKKEYLIYALIILVQMAVIIYWASCKVNYFSDEFMTMGYTRGFTGLEPTAQYITLSPEWTYNEWHTNREFKIQLLMTDKTALWKAPILDAIKRTITGRNYFALLNITEAIMGFDEVSNAPAVVLNLIFFAISEISLISLMKKLSMNFYSRCMAISLFGFSSYFVSMAGYVRFYMLTTALFILMMNLFYRLWEEGNLKRIIMYEVEIFALAYFSLKNTELTGPYFGCISLMFIIGLLMTKKWKTFATYSAMCVMGVAYIYFFTGYIKTILNPEGKNGMDAIIISSISSDTVEFMRTYKDWVVELLVGQLFGHYRILLIGAAILSGFVLFKLCRPVEMSVNDNKLRVSKVSFALLISWLAILYVASFRNKGILLSKAGLGLTVLGILYEMFGKRINIKQFKLGLQTGFVIMLVGAGLLYSVFTSLPHLRIWRYYYFVAVTVIILLWYVFDRILKVDSFKPALPGIRAILMAFVLAVSIAPFITKSIFYTYSEDAEFINGIRELGDVNVVINCRLDHGQYEQYIYDCVNILSNDSKVYLVNESDFTPDKVELADEFIFWDHQKEDVSEFLNEFSKRGYEIQNLDKDHVSQAYYCRINS